ncbi:hypothetical protein NL676_035281 [Syzygium grande]|nr:hypothetical protein NL676_035281 [Syzygium grande]
MIHSPVEPSRRPKKADRQQEQRRSSIFSGSRATSPQIPRISSLYEKRNGKAEAEASPSSRRSKPGRKIQTAGPGSGKKARTLEGERARVKHPEKRRLFHLVRPLTTPRTFSTFRPKRSLFPGSGPYILLRPRC